MSLLATRRALRTLEAHAQHDISASQDAALRRLTDAELETLCTLMDAHRARMATLPITALGYMPQPAWATAEEWAVLQRYACLYREHWMEGDA